MTMYLPNPDLQPTGAEMTEFIDVPPTSDTPHRRDTRTDPPRTNPPKPR